MSRSSTDWFAVFALFAAGLVASMHFAKLAPVMEQVGTDLGLSLVQSGFAVSILGIVGVFFSIAVGALVASTGLANGLNLALFGGAIVAVLGGLAPNGFLFLATRFLEGFSHLLIVVCAPGIMANSAKVRDKPIVLALWGCFFGFGFAITSAVAPPIIQAFGWRGLMHAHGIVLFVVGILVMAALHRAGYRDEPRPLPGWRSVIEAHRDVFRSGAPLLLAMTFCAYTILFLAVLTFLGRYMTDVQRWSAAATGSFLATVTLGNLILTLLAGVFVRRGVTLQAGLMTAFVLTAASAVGVFVFQPDDAVVFALVLIMMGAFGLMPGFIFANVPAVAPTQAVVALTFGAISLFGNVGTFAGTPLFAYAYSIGGWPGGAAFVVAACVAGIGLTMLLARKMGI